MLKTIKKTITLILTVLLLLPVSGCSSPKHEHLPYQNADFACTAGMRVNGKDYSINVSKESNNFVLSFTAPSEISGVSIEKTSEGLFFSAGSVHIPMKEGSNVSAEALKLFQLSDKDLKNTSTELYGGVKVNVTYYDCSFGNVKLIQSADTGNPLRIEADVNGNEVILSISEFTISKPQ